MIKTNKGITLIALVITIIVLIILAGISISILTGEDGLITKAKQGAQNYQNAAIEEQTMLNNIYDGVGIETAKGNSSSTGTLYDLTEKQRQIDELQAELNALKADLGEQASTSDKILKDYKAYVQGQLVTGTMENRGAVTETIAPGETYTIPEGYHNGTGTVTANQGGGTAQLVGTYTGNQSINVASYKRSTDTANNFIVEITSVSGNTTADMSPNSDWIWPKAKFYGSTPSKSLSGDTLSISNMTSTVSLQFFNSSRGYVDQKTASISYTYKVWHI